MSTSRAATRRGWSTSPPVLLSPPWELVDAEAHGPGGVLLLVRPLVRLSLPPPQDTPVSQRTRSSGVHIDDSTPASGRLVLVRPKPEPGLPAEYEEIARRGFSDEEALRWARDDYLRDEMVRQRRAL